MVEDLRGIVFHGKINRIWKNMSKNRKGDPYDKNYA